MRLSDIMSAMRLSSYAELALAIFMLAFLAIAVHLLRARDGATWERARFLPLEPEPIRIDPRSVRQR
jgi:hypothetical protein